MIYLVLIFTFITIAISENDECQLLLNISRDLKKDGFHRDLAYSFELITYGVWDDCQICLEEQVPKGVFANKNQIDELERFGKISAYINGTDDIESPETESTEQIVRIYVNLTRKYSILEGSAVFPIHVRYHMAKTGGGSETAFINLPSVYISCNLWPSHCETEVPVEIPCSPGNDNLCLFQPLKYNINTEVLEIQIPVGDKEHRNLVYFATLLVTTIGTVYILVTIMKNKPSK